MFTGIIKKVGEIKKIEERKGKFYFEILAENFLKGVKIGGSISCDGACLTVISKTKNAFEVELMPETLKVTKFRNSRKGDLINLELATKIGDRLDGHFVLGHVDGVGKIKKIIKDGEYSNLMVEIPRQLMKYLSKKGSVSLNGVSLTIADEGKDWFLVCLISHTLKMTNLSKLKAGDIVNIEVDVISRYLEKLLKNEN